MPTISQGHLALGSYRIHAEHLGPIVGRDRAKRLPYATRATPRPRIIGGPLKCITLLTGTPSQKHGLGPYEFRYIGTFMSHIMSCEMYILCIDIVSQNVFRDGVEIGFLSSRNSKYIQCAFAQNMFFNDRKPLANDTQRYPVCRSFFSTNLSKLGF